MSRIQGGRRRGAVAVTVGLAMALSTLGAGGPGPVGAEEVAPRQAGPDGFGQAGIPERPASERYVREAYTALLGRDAEPSGLAYWGDRLDAGANRAGFARQLLFTTEALRRQLRMLYQDLGLEPRGPDLTADTTAILRGAIDLEDVLIRIMASNEVYDEAGGTPEDYVTALYRMVLGRSPDGPGAAHWLGQLEAGEPRSAVAQRFAFSLDRRRAVVAASYDQVLGRVPDGPGWAHWAAQLDRDLRHLDLLQALLASGEAWARGCGAFGQGHCLLPFPNDMMTLPDPTTDTGRRVVLKPPWVPAPVDGPAFDPTEWNRQDGFSPGSAIMVVGGAIDPGRSGLAPLTDIGASLDPDAPLVIVDVDSGERWPYWAELDSNAPAGADRALVVRPARNLRDGRTYAVGFGPMADAEGRPLAAPAAFRTFRDQRPSPYRRVEAQREAVEAAIEAVVDAGLDRSTLHLAWTFTVASTRNLAERIIHMRDESLGDTAPFTVTSVTAGDDQTTRIAGTFQVPNYLTGTGAPGSRLRLGSDHLPEAQGTVTAPFVCTVPDSARTTPARATLYGHGLLGTADQAYSSATRPLAREHNMALCGTAWSGMAQEDIVNVVGVVTDLSRFPTLADRTQQGLLNFMALGRLMTRPDGFAGHASFRHGGDALIDGADLTYYGLSQGGIMGGALVATSPDITRGVLGVPGMNYSTLLERSVDFDPFFAVLSAQYPRALDRILLVSVVQMLWDRGEANGYANHMTADPLPGTPVHHVLLQVAHGDHQVTQYAADVMARTYGAATNDPPLAPGRLPGFVEPLWGIERIESFPHHGSALVYWDSGTPPPPVTNVPNRAGTDPHGDPRADPDARDQISTFLRPDGPVVDVCDGAACRADRS